MDEGRKLFCTPAEKKNLGGREKKNQPTKLFISGDENFYLRRRKFSVSAGDNFCFGRRTHAAFGCGRASVPHTDVPEFWQGDLDSYVFPTQPKVRMPIFSQARTWDGRSQGSRPEARRNRDLGHVPVRQPGGWYLTFQVAAPHPPRSAGMTKWATRAAMPRWLRSVSNSLVH